MEGSLFFHHRGRRGHREEKMKGCVAQAPGRESQTVLFLCVHSFSFHPISFYISGLIM